MVTKGKSPFRVRTQHCMIYHCPQCNSDVDMYGHYKKATPMDLSNLVNSLEVVEGKLVSPKTATVTCPHCGHTFNPYSVPEYARDAERLVGGV